ncbi:MAG: hypothetical protein ACYTG1_02795 [Planctomycetota bacterium]|jgi:hypothetical protein
MRAFPLITGLLLAQATLAASPPAEPIGRQPVPPDGIIVIPIRGDGIAGALAINTNAPGWAAAAAGAGGPTLPQFLDVAVFNYGAMSFGGDPPTQVQVTDNIFGIIDDVPFGLFATGFDINQLPVRSSHDMGLGDVDSLDPLFGPYLAEFPETQAAISWFTTGLSGQPPALVATTTTTSPLPRDLFPAFTLGDSEHFDLLVTGAPDIGDGVVGWTFTGVIARDCTVNGIDDALDIAADPSLDQDANGTPDACEAQSCNLDVSNAGFAWGPVDPLVGGVPNQRGQWTTLLGIPPDGIPLPLRNTGGVICGAGFIPHYDNNLITDLGWFNSAPTELQPLLADGWDMGIVFGPVVVEIVGLAPGDYGLTVYADRPDIPGESVIGVPGQPAQTVVSAPWTGDFVPGVTHAEFVYTTSDGTIPVSFDDGPQVGIQPFFNGFQLTPLSDCDLDGEPDLTLLDLDGNGIADLCEMDVTCRQYSWVDATGVTTAPFTDLGELTVTMPEPPHGDVAFFNAVIDGEWVVRNGLVMPIDGDGGDQSYSFMFGLDTPPGTAVDTVECILDLTDTALVAAPQAAFTVPLPVLQADFRAGLEADPLHVFGTFTPGPAEDFVGGLFADPDAIVRRGVPSVSEPANHCVPGGLARCLSWLNDIYCLGFPPDCVDPQQIHDDLAADYLSTTEVSGTTVPNQLAGTQQFIADKGLASTLDVSQISIDNGDTPSPDDMMNGLKQGKDVMFVVIWLDAAGDPAGAHFMTVVAGVEGATPADHQFALKDDAHGINNQGDGLADVGVTNIKFRARAGGGWEMTGHGIGSNMLKRVVLICPRRLAQLDAISKYAVGDVGAILEIAELSGTLPSPSELDEVLRRSCDAFDIARFLFEQVSASPLAADPDVMQWATNLLGGATDLKDLAMTLHGAPGFSTIDQMLNTIDTGIAPHLCLLRSVLDCNDNFIDDSWEIEQGLLPDADGDGIADDCPPTPVCTPLPSDTNGDGVVDVQDLLQVLGDWGPCPVPPDPCPADVDDTTAVDVGDLLQVLADWTE